MLYWNGAALVIVIKYLSCFYKTFIIWLLAKDEIRLSRSIILFYYLSKIVSFLLKTVNDININASSAVLN